MPKPAASGLSGYAHAGLTWEQVDLSRRLAWIHPNQAKARKAIAVPLNDMALQVLRDQRGKHAKWAFTYEGQRIMQVSTRAWYHALERAVTVYLRPTRDRQIAVRPLFGGPPRYGGHAEAGQRSAIHVGRRQ